jgi:hypothetical protein
MKRLLGIAALAAALVMTGGLAGCAGRGRLASHIRPAGNVNHATGTQPAGSSTANTSGSDLKAAMADAKKASAGLKSLA